MKDTTLTQPERDGSAGFTMLELLVGMVIMGVLGAMSTSGWLSYQRTVEHRGSAQELVSALRNAQQRALSEATTYCMRMDAGARSYALYRGGCTAPAPVQTAVTQSGRIGLLSPSFLQPDGSQASDVQFTPRGSATKGSVTVTRENSGKQYVINVEGLTGRVSITG